MATVVLMIVALAVAACLGGVFARRNLAQAPCAGTPDRLGDGPDLGPVFLFRGTILIDATADALQLIAPFGDLPDHDAVLQALAPEFPLLRAQLDQPAQGPVRLAHRSDAGVWLDLDWPGGHLRARIRGSLPSPATVPDSAELTLLRSITGFAPQLIWRTDNSGDVTWANQAYLDFWDRLHPGRIAVLAQKILFPAMTPPAIGGAPNTRRIAIPLQQQGAEHWFDVTLVVQDGWHLHFASDANAAVRADLDRRNFVQTLGKTFAELAIGLAIFDKRRELATFNPALLDMTRLSFEFLSSRPTIDTLLDRLRETRILPEPKDYASWRDQFTAVETAAKNGSYCEVWNLPDGQAFRVTGRPHPDGAFAFLFEDITADLSLTRRFRSDIETGQAVLDALPDAVAVFSGAGTLVMYNRAYTLLWGMQVTAGLEHRALGPEMAIWQERCLATGMWVDLAQFIRQQGPRKPVTDDALLSDGRLVRCHAGPIAGGMTMVRFTLGAPGLPALRKLTQRDPAIRAALR